MLHIGNEHYGDFSASGSRLTAHYTDEKWATRALLKDELTDDNIRREI